MAKKDRICVCCQKPYEYCPTCNPKDKLLPTWYFAYCSESCKTIYNTLCDYDRKDIDAKTAKDILNNCDLSRKDYFGPSYIRILDDIDKAVANSETKTEPKFTGMNKPVEDETTAIAEVTNKKVNINTKATKDYKKIK